MYIHIHKQTVYMFEHIYTSSPTLRRKNICTHRYALAYGHICKYIYIYIMYMCAGFDKSLRVSDPTHGDPLRSGL